MEAELTALDTASTVAEWLRELLLDLLVVEKPIPAILMNYDNQIVITKVNMLSIMRSQQDTFKDCQEVEKLQSNSSGIRANR